MQRNNLVPRSGGLSKLTHLSHNKPVIAAQTPDNCQCAGKKCSKAPAVAFPVQGLVRGSQYWRGKGLERAEGDPSCQDKGSLGAARSTQAGVWAVVLKLCPLLPMEASRCPHRGAGQLPLGPSSLQLTDPVTCRRRWGSGSLHWKAGCAAKKQTKGTLKPLSTNQ